MNEKKIVEQLFDIVFKNSNKQCSKFIDGADVYFSYEKDGHEVVWKIDTENDQISIAAPDFGINDSTKMEYFGGHRYLGECGWDGFVDYYLGGIKGPDLHLTLPDNLGYDMFFIQLLAGWYCLEPSPETFAECCRLYERILKSAVNPKCEANFRDSLQYARNTWKIYKRR